MEKYKILKEEYVVVVGGTKLYRIEALRSFGNVSKGEKGGYIQKEENLSHYGDAWISGNAKIYGDAWIYGDAEISGDAWISGNAKISDNAWIYGDAWISGNVNINGDASISGDVEISGDAWISGDASIYGDDIFWVSKCGSEMRTTTVFKDSKIGWRVVCGCFTGTIEEFENKIRRTHQETKHLKPYLALVNYIKVWIESYGGDTLKGE